MRIWNLVHLFFPHLCAACQHPLASRKEALCFSCVQSLPYTHFKVDLPVFFTEKIPEAVDLNFAFSLLFFQKDTEVQQLLHELKYQGNRQLGEMLGKLMGIELKKRGKLFDVIVPVPLHPKKIKSRGYNQAQLLAKGIGEILWVPVIENALVRIKNTESQTQKSLSERALNVKGAFEVVKTEYFNKNNVLLVDDVFTTGSTLLSVSEAIWQVSPYCKMNWTTLAMALPD